MTSKKISSKKKESTESTDFSEKILEIEECLHNINKVNNISKILKSHDDIKEKINSTSEQLKQIKQQFELVKNNATQAEKINDDTFEEYIEDVGKDITKDFNEMELDVLVSKYKKILEKIKSCEKYLKDKKMEITYCKDDNNETDTENSSES